MAVLYPGNENFAQVYRELEAITGDPRLIATTTDGPGLGLVVSDDVYNLWVDAHSTDTEETETPKRRGRPRKIQES